MQEKESYQRQMSMSRGSSRRGGDRGDFQFEAGPDGWTKIAIANNIALQPPPKFQAGDLSNFGKINSTSKGLPMTFGPSSVFSGKDSKRESLSPSDSPTSSRQKMFSMLSQGTKPPVPSRKTSVDLASGTSPEAPPQRRRLILRPRWMLTTEEQGSTTAEATPTDSHNSSHDEEAASEMSEEDANKKISEDLKEFFAIRDLDEAEVYFSALPVAHHHRLVDRLVGTAVDSNVANVQLVADFFTRVVSKELCSVDAFEEGFSLHVELLKDIAIDEPKAPNNMALMMKAVSFDIERTVRIAAKSLDADKLLALLL